jgi:hypothetical protein
MVASHKSPVTLEDNLLRSPISPSNGDLFDLGYILLDETQQGGEEQGRRSYRIGKSLLA